MNKTIRYRNWTFEVDYNRTKEVYDKIEFGSPESCNCNDCKNFIANRENIYPLEIKRLLESLGINPKKESEIYHMARLENGLHHYGGWFHFKGKIKKGKDCKIDFVSGGSRFETERVTNHFGIAFMKGSDLSFFNKEEKEQLIQVEFIADSEWIIDKELESE
ncbi:hypothetical protein QQ008_11310 [Fulvivirgaceae bacterium BMA10]|uniref:Uncharacterized protein n=1 Tax=Splendidivirga corallicola TaxID=3051826 RepID=A0ABT8KP05_9BACT|nr:hypothetical protein [Fulvivirgaceae bacterium BMA10]